MPAPEYLRLKSKPQTNPVSIVPRDSSGLRSLCQDRLEVRIPSSTSNHSPSKLLHSRHIFLPQANLLPAQPHHQIPLFSLQDMRVFQHFLTQCYPHHPLKQEEIWTHEIPCLAHNVGSFRSLPQSSILVDLLEAVMADVT